MKNLLILTIVIFISSCSRGNHIENPEVIIDEKTVVNSTMGGFPIGVANINGGSLSVEYIKLDEENGDMHKYYYFLVLAYPHKTLSITCLIVYGEGNMDLYVTTEMPCYIISKDGNRRFLARNPRVPFHLMFKKGEP